MHGLTDFGGKGPFWEHLCEEVPPRGFLKSGGYKSVSPAAVMGPIGEFNGGEQEGG